MRFNPGIVQVTMSTFRLKSLIRFYGALDQLEANFGGKRALSTCDGRMSWPDRGVYFFFEQGEQRSDSGAEPRVVRVGTHALISRSRTSLWNRLSQHRGVARSGGGNHRGSIFRLLVGAALMEKGSSERVDSWGRGASAPADVRAGEEVLERNVSSVIGAMPFLWLPIDDPPSPGSLRGYVERNAIALLSNFDRPALDEPSQGWLGLSSPRERVRGSGLWNNNHVDEIPDPDFVPAFEQMIAGLVGKFEG